MKKQFFILLLALCLPVSSFAGWKFRVGKAKAKTPITGTAPARQVRGGMTEKGPLARTSVPQGPITRGVQQGVLRHLEVPTSNARIPARRSNPRFEWGRKLREQRDSFNMFVRAMKEGDEKLLRARLKKGQSQATRFRFYAKALWEEKEKVSEHEFYFHLMLKAMLWHAQFKAEQLVNLRTFYEKTISHPEVFTSDRAFADALSASLNIGYVGDGYLAEKITSLAKHAPEGKRLLTDFVVVRSLLNLERYDLVEELMNFRKEQEKWFQEGKFIGGETSSVYEEVKLYQQTVKDIPVTFSEELPARSKFAFSEQDKQIRKLMEPRPSILLFEGYLKHNNLELLRPETSAEDLEWFLQYKQRDFSAVGK